MSEQKTDTSAETFQEGTTPVQAFTSGVVAVTPDKAALTRRGRPPRILRDEKVESKKDTSPTEGVASANASAVIGAQVAAAIARQTEAENKQSTSKNG